MGVIVRDIFVQNLNHLASGWSEGEYSHDKLVSKLNQAISESRTLVVCSLVIVGWDFPRRSEQYLKLFVDELTHPVAITEMHYSPYFYRTDSQKPEGVNPKDPVFTWFEIETDLQRRSIFEINDILADRLVTLIQKNIFSKVVEHSPDQIVLLSIKKGAVILNPNSPRKITGNTLLTYANKNAYLYSEPYEIK